MGAREQAVADGVGDGRFTEALVPVGDRELARDDRAAQARPVLDHLEEVSRLRIGERLEGEVVEDEDVDPRPGCEQTRQPPVGPGRRDLAEQS